MNNKEIILLKLIDGHPVRCTITPLEETIELSVLSKIIGKRSNYLYLFGNFTLEDIENAAKELVRFVSQHEKEFSILIIKFYENKWESSTNECIVRKEKGDMYCFQDCPDRNTCPQSAK